MERFKPFICGGTASIVAEFGTFPIDTTKTRLQIQEGFQSIKYKGMLDCGVKIFREEGVRSLFHGISPAILRQSIYGTLKFGSYYSLKNFIVERFCIDDSTENIYVNVTCAAFSGGISSAIANPTDVLKVRMQIQGKGNSRGLPLHKSFVEVYKTEGVRGLYRGVWPTSQRAMTIATVELPVYDLCKNYLMDYVGNQPINHFASSFVASLLAAVASCPIDVIRTRLMNQRKIINSQQGNASGSTIYFNNSLECLRSILKNEGALALWKGFLPSFVRMGPWNISFFLIYEALMNTNI